ncbi:MAG: S9 family peptidase [Pseudomonadota bacterium]
MLRNNRKNLRTSSVAFLLCLVSPLLWANPSLEDFLREADIRDAELSPDGTHLAMVTHKDNVRTVVVRDVTKAGLPIVGALAGDIVRPNYLHWANNDRLLVVMSVPFNAKNVQRAKEKKDDFDINEYFMFSRMISVGKELSDPVVLLEDERRLKRNYSLSRVTNFLPDDESHILMDAFRGEKRIQYKVNIESGESEQVTAGSRYTYQFLNDADGRPRFRFDYRRRSKAIVIYKYTESDDWETVEKIYLNKDDEDSLGITGLIAVYEDRLVYRRQNDASGYYELVVVDNETGAVSTMVSLPDQDVRGSITNLRSDEMIGYTVEKDFVRNVYFDEDRQKEYDAIAVQVGKYNFNVLNYSNKGERALIRSWGPDDPSSYQLWDDKSQQLTLLANAYENLPKANLSVPAMATYTARDGTKIRSYILFPKDYKKGESYPTVLMPHGGPHTRSRATYDMFAQFLSTRGYVVVDPNFRGSVGYGRDFEQAGYQQWGGLMQDDLTDAARFMIEEGISDPEKICIVGGSYGGYAALMGAIKTPELFTCAVSVNGVTHLSKIVKFDMIKHVDEADWQDVLFDRIGHPKDDQELLDANSPALHADKIQIPVLLIAGREDEIVPFSQSRMMQKALKREGVEYEFVILADAGHHAFYYRDDAEKSFKAIEKFLKVHLQ